jgi:benzylsuccinate CoA-transferase BbsF subunit
MWALAGPGATRTLADCGARVVRIESTSRLDVCRTLNPWLNGEIGPENSAIFHSTNAGKRMLTLDPTTPEGREVVLDLVRWADVVTESFSPRGMKGFGLDYETLREVKPDLIMLSTCLMGQTGPLARFAGFGNLAAAISGFHELTGWPDRDPAGPFSAYTDYIAPRYNAIAVLAALEHRRRTGQGQHIDLSQAEAALHFLAPAMLEYTVNGTIPSRVGNRDGELAPHGVYPAAGDDDWVAVACRDDADWRGQDRRRGHALRPLALPRRPTGGGPDLRGRQRMGARRAAGLRRRQDHPTRHRRRPGIGRAGSCKRRRRAQRGGAPYARLPERRPAGGLRPPLPGQDPQF